MNIPMDQFSKELEKNANILRAFGLLNRIGKMLPGATKTVAGKPGFWSKAKKIGGVAMFPAFVGWEASSAKKDALGGKPLIEGMPSARDLERQMGGSSPY